MCMDGQWMIFHHLCSLHNWLDEKCVCLEYCKERNQAKIEILNNYLNRLRKEYMKCWKRNFITTKLFNYVYELTMITPLNARVVVHFVKLLIKIAETQVTLLLEENGTCLLSEAMWNIFLDCSLPFHFYETVDSKNGKLGSQREE